MADPVVVIGGGPAGATAATLLAQGGYEVVLFEAARFPRPHVGESLLPATLAVLNETGVLPKVRAANFVRKNGATMSWGTEREPWSWYFRETNQNFPHSYQVFRPTFDKILLDHARECGVSVHEATPVKRVEFSGEEVRGVEVDGQVVAASFVVDATGQRSLLGTQLELKEWDDFFQNIAVYGYFDGGEHLGGEDAGNIFLESVPSGWIWKIPLQDGVSSVGIVGDRDRCVAEIRKSNSTQWFHEVLSAARYIGPMLADSTLRAKPTVTRDWSYCCRTLAGPRHCLVGDAACFIDPLFSTGVHLAVSGAMYAAAYVHSVLAQTATPSLAQDGYTGLCLQQYRHFHELARLFYHGNTTMDSYFWKTREITGERSLEPRSAFVRAVSGQSALGYERAMLSRSLLPDSIANSIKQIETTRRELEYRLLHVDVLDFVPKFAEQLELQRSAVMADRTFVDGWVLRGRHRGDLPISEFVKRVLASVDGRRTGETILAELVAEGYAEHDARKPLQDSLALLALDGILSLEHNE